MKWLTVAMVTSWVVVALFIVGCGVSVESEPSEAHAAGQGCATTVECSNRSVELLEEIRDTLDKQGTNY